jgi:hypothetical protein
MFTAGSKRQNLETCRFEKEKRAEVFCFFIEENLFSVSSKWPLSKIAYVIATPSNLYLIYYIISHNLATVALVNPNYSDRVEPPLDPKFCPESGRHRMSKRKLTVQ